MKFFKILALICLFVLFVGCEDSIQRITPAADKPDDGNSDVTDDSDATDTDDPANPTDEPTNPTDEPTNPTDPTDEPTNPTDDPTNPTDDPTDPTDDPTNPTDEPTNPTDEPTNPTDDEDIIPDEDNPELTDEEKCAAAGGTWDSFAEEDYERCYKIVECAAKPANTEWRGDQSYTEYYDIDDGQWTNFGANYTTEYGDTGEAKICQYVCASNAVYEDDTCKPICSAVFNGTDSRIEVAHNDLLNLGSGSWTIEAWIKQDEEDLTSNYAPILRKGTSENPSYVLTGYRKQQSGSGNHTTTKYTVTGATTYKSVMGSNTEDLQVEGTDNEFSGGWTHVALVHRKDVESIGAGGLLTKTTYTLTLYVNGQQKKSDTYSPNTTSNLLESNEPLVIGANLYSSFFSAKTYFKGLIDSIRILSSEKYTGEFTPSKLSAEGDDIIAFWDFNGDTVESKNNMSSSPTNISTYSTDCAF